MTTRVCLTHLGGGYQETSGLAPWVKRDVQILETRTRLHTFFYRSWRDIPELASNLLRSDVSLNWFAWDNALWAIRLGAILRVPGIVIVAGFDVANEPDLEYGALRTSSGKSKVRKILERAAHVFAISEFVRRSALNVAPEVSIEILPLGFDSTEFSPGPEWGERHGVCTVGDVDENNLRRKGIGDVIEVAKHLEDIPVYIVGQISPSLSEIVDRVPRNVTFLGHVPHETLVRVFHNSRLYLQFSRHEGFGAALAESMLCRCTPIVSRAGALPEVAGNTGYYTELGDSKQIAEVVRGAFEGPGRGNAARQRVIDLFSLEQRQRLLLRRLEGIRSLN